VSIESHPRGVRENILISERGVQPYFPILGLQDKIFHQFDAKICYSIKLRQIGLFSSGQHFGRAGKKLTSKK
jgi:hypothetical protein